MSGPGYAEMKDSGVAWLGEVPAHWGVKRLVNCLRSIESGSREQGEVKLTNGIPSLGGEHIGTEGEILLKNMRYVSQSFFENLRKGAVKEHDTLLVKDGATIGKVAFVRTLPFAECAVNEHVFIMRSAHDYLPEFLYQNIRSKEVQEGIWQQVTGAAQPGLNSSFIKRISLCCPPLSEQSAIVAFLYREGTRIDALVEKKKQQIALLKEKRIALISHAVTKGLAPNAAMKDSGVEWLGEVPGEWQLKKLKHFSFAQFSNVDKHTVEGEQYVRLCNYSDVYYNEVITPDMNLMEATATPSEIQKFQLRDGDVLITKDSESWEDIAVPAYVDGDHADILCGYHLAQIRPKQEHVYGKYLFWSFCAKANNHQFCVAAAGITRYGIGKYWIDNGIFPMPPKLEQTAIAAFLDRETAQIDALIKKIGQSIDLLREYRVALISDAVTGKIDVRKE